MRTLWQAQPDPAVINREEAKNHVQRHNLAGFRAPKLDTVRVGVIGLGNRGPNHLKALVQIANVEIRALCDKNPLQIERGLVWTRGAGHTILLQHDAHTQWSATHRSQAMDVPDFTAGAWQTNPRNMDIDLANGGGDTRILPPSKAAMDFDDELARQWARDHA
jgi:hypothetical protein